MCIRDRRYTKESIRSLMETMAADARGKYGTVLLSYRDRAFPREEEIKEIFAEHYGLVRVRGMEVDYNIAKDIGREGKHARELLFVASKSRGAPRSKADTRAPAACHTSFLSLIHIFLSIRPCGLRRVIERR